MVLLSHSLQSLYQKCSALPVILSSVFLEYDKGFEIFQIFFMEIYLVMLLNSLFLIFLLFHRLLFLLLGMATVLISLLDLFAVLTILWFW
jgi:hypothetical protein